MFLRHETSVFVTGSEFRVGSIAAIPRCTSHVRFAPDSGHKTDMPAGRFGAKLVTHAPQQGASSLDHLVGTAEHPKSFTLWHRTQRRGMGAVLPATQDTMQDQNDSPRVAGHGPAPCASEREIRADLH